MDFGSGSWSLRPNFVLELQLARSTHRILSSSFLGLPYRILNINHNKELLRSLGQRIGSKLSGLRV